MRTTVAGAASVADAMTLASPSGTLSSPATLTAELTAAGWTTADSTGVSTQKTEAIFPLASGYRPSGVSDWFWIANRPDADRDKGQCLDITGSATANGTAVGYWTCTTNDNQTFQMTPVAGSTPSAVTLRPLNAPASNVSALAGGTMALASPDPSQASQRWIVQDRSNGSATPTYQLVNAATGKCMSAAAGSALVDCNASTATLHLLRRTAAMTPNSLSVYGGTFTFTVRNSNHVATLQYQRTNGQWVDWGTESKATTWPGQISISVSTSPTYQPAGSSYPVRLLWGAEVVWTGTARTNNETLDKRPVLTAGGG